MHTAEPICGIPVTVLTPGNAAPLTQNQLDDIGDSVHQTIAPKSEHWIHLDEPDLVISAIRAMIGAPPIAVAARPSPRWPSRPSLRCLRTPRFSRFPAPRAEAIFAIL
jgi:hypothetical protein